MAVGQVIGKQLGNGFAGGYAIQPDMLVAARVNVGDDVILFGDLVVYDDTDTSGVRKATDPTDKKIAGICSREVKQSNVYNQQDLVGFAKYEAVNCFQRGIISVVCTGGQAKLGADVYWKDGTGFTADSSGAVKIEGMQFAGTTDANGIVAVSINEKLHV